MQSDEKLSLSAQQRQSARSLRQSFSSLVDALRFAYRKDQLEQKIRELQEAASKSTVSLDGLTLKIDAQVKALGETVEENLVKELAIQITNFSQMAVEQTKAKIVAKSGAELAENKGSLDSETTKMKKSLEAFMATGPFQIIDQIITVKLVDGAYEARGRYRCSDDISYEFSYDTKKSRMLSKEVRISNFEKDFKIPISVGKTWLRKDQVPDYERIDQYALVSAESSENSLIVVLKHPEKDGSIKLVFSKHDSHSSLSVEYVDSQRSVNVSSTPSLNRFLDSDSLERIVERLWLAIIDLQNFKSGLAKLVFDNHDILEKLDCFPFFEKSWKIISPRVAQELEKNGDEKRAIVSEDRMTEKFVREKIGLLGENGDVLLSSLILNQRSAKEEYIG